MNIGTAHDNMDYFEGDVALHKGSALIVIFTVVDR